MLLFCIYEGWNSTGSSIIDFDFKELYVEFNDANASLKKRLNKIKIIKS